MVLISSSLGILSTSSFKKIEIVIYNFFIVKKKILITKLIDIEMLLEN